MPNKLTDVTDIKVGKMTDSEIVKALKEILEIMLTMGDLQKSSTISKAIDLINRLQAENNRLDNENDELKADIDFLNRENEKLQAENERLKEPTSASFIHILAEKTIESLQKENEEYEKEIMRLEHNERVLSKNSIIANYPHHWLLAEGWFLSKEPDGYGMFKAQVSNEAYKECIEKAKSELKNISKFDFHGTYYYLVGEAFFDNLLKELVGE